MHKTYFEFLCKNFLPSHYCIPHFFENWVKVFSVLFFCTNEREEFCCYCQGICRRWTAIYFPLYYIAGEKAIFTTVFLTFFKPFTIRRKNRVLGGVFWKVCAPLPRFCYYAQNILRVFVQEFFCPLYYFIPHFFGKIQPFFQKRFRTSEAIKNLSIIQSRQNSKRYPPRKSLSLYAEKNGFCRGGFEEIYCICYCRKFLSCCYHQHYTDDNKIKHKTYRRFLSVRRRRYFNVVKRSISWLSRRDNNSWCSPSIASESMPLLLL